MPARKIPCLVVLPDTTVDAFLHDAAIMHGSPIERQGIDGNTTTVARDFGNLHVKDSRITQFSN